LEEYDLLECIDKGLEPFGSNVKQTIYWNMTILHGSQRAGLIGDPSVFAKVLEEIFGASAVGIEKSIIREIRKVFKLSVEDRETLKSAIVSATDQVVPVSSKIQPLAVTTRSTVEDKRERSMSILGNFLAYRQTCAEKQVNQGEEREKKQIATETVVTQTQATFESGILGCVQTGLALFGDSFPQLIMYNLKWLNGIKQEEIPHKPEEFGRCLDQVFRAGSASVKEALIAEVKSKFGLTEDYASLKESFAAAASRPI